jgi:tRNA threonylcarbamoyladenosine biosynthesis protein TsaE
LRWRSPSPERTREAGRRLARAFGPGGGTLALVGPLGAGKTLFVQGLALGLGLDPARVTSPTFVIAQEYEPVGPGPRLVHVDLYRLVSRDEIEAAGFADWLVPGNLVAIEWADRFPDALPEDRLELTLAPLPGEPGSREIRALACGAESAAALRRWRAALSGSAELEPIGPGVDCTAC